jgi:hypothetical protein
MELRFPNGLLPTRDEEKMVVIDHIAGLTIDERDGINELITLSCLTSGLDHLNSQIAAYEGPIRDFESSNRKKVNFFGFGFELLPEEAENLIPCLFHWYGVSVINYARLVGFAGGIGSGALSRDMLGEPKGKRKIKDYCSNYVENIEQLSAVRLWRNKVYAHIAATDPRGTDTAALLAMSTMSPISYFDHRFRTSNMTIMALGGEATMPSWSLTEVHLHVRQRYVSQIPAGPSN